jgi:hypothetical protein
MSVETDRLPAVQNAKPPAREIRVVEDHGAQAYLFDTARFEHLQRVAQLMANSALTPAHLKGSTPAESMANCFRVTNQAIRWGFDPFAICDETYVVHGRLGYQGKLVAAVVNARAGLKERLKYEFTGKDDSLAVTVIGQFANEDKPRTIDLTLQQAMMLSGKKSDNHLFRTNPKQKLIYSGATIWARAHCPEVLLGALTEDDLEAIAAREPMPTRFPDEDLRSRITNVVEQAPKEETKPPEQPTPAPVQSGVTSNPAPEGQAGAGQESRIADMFGAPSAPVQKPAEPDVKEIDARIKALFAGTVDQVQEGAALIQKHRGRFGEPWALAWVDVYRARIAELNKAPAPARKRREFPT